MNVGIVIKNISAPEFVREILELNLFKIQRDVCKLMFVEEDR